MKKMLLSGCSHSVGLGLNDIKKSWGNIFAKNNNYELTNVAHNGCSLQYSIQQIINKIFEEKYDTIILQLTDFCRYPIPFNGENIFFSNNITDANKNISDVFHLNRGFYLEANDGYKFDIKTEVINFFYEKVIYSTFYLNTVINEIYLLQQLLKKMEIDFILIPYDDYAWGYDSMMSIWKFENSKKIDKTRYIDCPFMKWLKDNYNPDDFYIDKGFHLSEEGHRIFAEEYLPSFIKIN